MKFRNLEKVRLIIKDATGLDLSYAYDDLVFPDNVAFLIRFDDDKENNLICHFREDCIPDERTHIENNLSMECKKNNCTIATGSDFNLKQKGEEVQILFK